MFTYEVNLLCDNPHCNSRHIEVSEPFSSGNRGRQQVMEEAKKQGWKISIVNNQYHALCPDCSEEPLVTAVREARGGSKRSPKKPGNSAAAPPALSSK